MNLQINGEDVRCASHEHVVDLIRSSGSLVTMTVISQMYPNNFQQQQQVSVKQAIWIYQFSGKIDDFFFSMFETATAIRINDECSTMCNITA